MSVVRLRSCSHWWCVVQYTTLVTPCAAFSIFSSAVLRQPSRVGHYRPFSSEDEEKLAAVLTSKPRHVARYVRQSVLHSRRRVTHFRNSVTFLMIALQSKLQKGEITPSDASALVEGLMKECVELRQGDMAHLLFRASIRFRKYGMGIGYALVKHLFDSYRADNAKELMRSMAAELRGDVSLRMLAVLAYHLSGDHSEGSELLQTIPSDKITTADYCALLDVYGVSGRYDDIASLVKQLLDPRSGVSCVDLDLNMLLSSSIVAIRGSNSLLQEMKDIALAKRAVLSEQAIGVLLRARLRTAYTVSDVYQAEASFRAEFGTSNLGMTAETCVIARCSEILSRGQKASDEMMLQKVQCLENAVEESLANDAIEDLDPSYFLSLIKGYGVLGEFESMKRCFNRLKEAASVRNSRLYDEMLRWYAHAYNLKEVIALKEEMHEQQVMHTAQTYQYLFRVLDRHYPRMVEKYLSEMRGKGIQIEPFMYPTLLRVFGSLEDYAIVEQLYREIKDKASAGYTEVFSPPVVVQLLKTYQHNPGRSEAIITEAENYGLLANEAVQAEIVQFYSTNDRYDDLHALVSRLPYKSPDIYRVLLRDASKRKDRRLFDALLHEMRENRVTVNERLFGTVMTALGHFNDLEGVKRYFHEALSCNVVRTPLFFAIAASAFARLGDVQSIDSCWNDLLQSKVTITMPVYNKFLDLYMTNHNVEMVQQILDTMMKLVPPNPVTATTVVDMLGKMGRIGEMESVLEEMTRSTNAVPTQVTYHQAMNAYAKSGDVAKMETMRERMREEGFQENHVTFNILFEGYGRAKRYERIKELVEERKSKQIPMDEFGYAGLLNIYSRARMAEEITQIVDEMVAGGVPFTSRMLSTLATSFSNIGDMPKMEQYVSLLLAHPDCRQKDVESVYLIYSKLRDTVKLQELLDSENLPKSQFTYNICVSAFARAGEHTKVASLLTQMEERGFSLSRNTSVTLSSLLLKAGKTELAQTVLKWKGYPSMRLGVYRKQRT
ncbi:PPR repeat Pentatricopeptide repeat domain [Trypanosoma vivax]|nr:PPR repeat Pentatricopeptide repeat domain [Trypanosoma vivax]